MPFQIDMGVFEHVSQVKSSQINRNLHLDDNYFLRNFEDVQILFYLGFLLNQVQRKLSSKLNIQRCLHQYFQYILNNFIKYTRLINLSLLPLKDNIISLYKQTQTLKYQMMNQIQAVIKDFYNAVLHNHMQKDIKGQILDLYFNRIRPTKKNIVQVANCKQSFQHLSLTTIENAGILPIQSRHPLTFSQFILYKKMSSINSNQSLITNQNPLKIKINYSFTTNSLYKLFVYALFINFIHINNAKASTQDQEDITHSYYLAQHILKRLKSSMVKTLMSFKASDKKKYAKNRYLYNQLLHYTKQKIKPKEQYIRVIIQQFDGEYLRKALQNFQLQQSELIYSRSMVNDSIFSEDFSNILMVEEFNKTIECLNAQLILLDGKDIDEEHAFDRFMNIVVEQLPNCSYQLKEIITFRTN